MAKEGQSGAIGRLARATERAGIRTAPGLQPWDPPDCGDIDMRIGADGTWYYQSTPIGRPALVRLFASVLKREGERYCLVTPVEKCGILVDDAPFLAVELAIAEAPGHDPPERVLRFRTNVDDWVDCDAHHPLRFEPEAGTGGLKPYLLVRDGLWAKVTRSVFQELVALAEEREIDGRTMFGVASGGAFFAMASAESVRDPI